jgi:hypothetical protein
MFVETVICSAFLLVYFILRFFPCVMLLLESHFDRRIEVLFVKGTVRRELRWSKPVPINRRSFRGIPVEFFLYIMLHQLKIRHWCLIEK